MRKFIATATGGVPVDDDDLLDVFNSELWAAIESILSSFDSNTEGIVVSGCVTTNNAGNFDMTAGIVYLAGEFLRVPAFINIPFPQYITPSSVTFETRTFEDLTVNNVIRVRGIDLLTSAPGSGQYLAITNLTDLDDRRFSPVLSTQLATSLAAKVNKAGDTMTGDLDLGAHNLNAGAGTFTDSFDLNSGTGGHFHLQGTSPAQLDSGIADSFDPATGKGYRRINIGDWNMDTTASITKAHGLGSSWVKILNSVVMIIDDTPSLISNLNNRGATIDGSHDIDSTNVNLRRVTSGFYDSTAYDATSYNRGFIYIEYMVFP